MRKSFIFIAALFFFISACTVEKIVNNDVFTKRKYKEGYFVYLPDKKISKNEGQKCVNFNATGEIANSRSEFIENDNYKLYEENIIVSSNDNEILKNEIIQSVGKKILLTNKIKEIKAIDKVQEKTKNEKVTQNKIDSSTADAFAIVSLVLSVLTILQMIICCAWYPVGMVLSLGGIVLSALSLKTTSMKGLAIAALVTSIVAFLLSISPLLFAASVLAIF